MYVDMEIDNNIQVKTNLSVINKKNISYTSSANDNSFNSNNTKNIKHNSIFSIDEQITNMNNENFPEKERENCREKKNERDNNQYISISPKHRDLKEIRISKKKEKISKFSKVDPDGISWSSLKSQELIEKILKIENILRNYLKDSHKFFKTKSIDEFIQDSQDNSQNTNSQNNEKKEKNIIPEFDKFNNILLDSVNSKKKFERKCTFESQNKFTSSIGLNMNNSNYSIPSCYKNFFEEKDNKILKENKFNSNVNYKKTVSNFNNISNFTNFLDLKVNNDDINEFGLRSLDTKYDYNSLLYNKNISGFSFDVNNVGEDQIGNRNDNNDNNPNNRRKSFPTFIRRQSSIITESLNGSIKESNSEYDNNSIIYEEDRDNINIKY